MMGLSKADIGNGIKKVFLWTRGKGHPEDKRFFDYLNQSELPECIIQIKARPFEASAFIAWKYQNNSDEKYFVDLGLKE